MGENPETAPGNNRENVSINEAEIASLLDRKVRESVEETINGLLDAEADALCQAGRYERGAERTDTRAGHDTRMVVNPSFDRSTGSGLDAGKQKRPFSRGERALAENAANEVPGNKG